jgi:hypothetical protein
MSKRYAIAAAIAAATAAYAGQAQAQITHQYMSSGHACQPAKTDVGKIQYNTQNGVFNDDSTNTATVYCPVNWDTLIEQQDPRPTFLNLVVSVADFHSTQNVTCKLVTIGPDERIVATVSKSSSGSFGNQLLVFTVSTVPSPVGSMAISCTLPAKVSAGTSRIIRYSLFDGPAFQ